MSDEADIAQAHMELEEAMRRKYNKPPEFEVDATGKCLNCFEPLSRGKRWCDPECHEDWDSRRRR